MFVVGVVIYEMNTNLGTTMSLTLGDMIGMMPVFETKEAALKEYPDSQITEILIRNQTNER